MLILKIYSSLIEAELAQQFLADHGIESTISVDNIGGMNPAMNFSAGVKVLVDENDLAKAQELLQLG